MRNLAYQLHIGTDEEYGNAGGGNGNGQPLYVDVASLTLAMICVESFKGKRNGTYCMFVHSNA